MQNIQHTLLGKLTVFDIAVPNAKIITNKNDNISKQINLFVVL